MNNAEYMYIKPEFLRADPLYQREVKGSRVKKIVNEFNPRLFNEPKVSKRADGFYYIIDGDHSVTAHKVKFGENTPILCKVFNGLSPAEEKEMFTHQHDNSQKVTRTDKLRADVNFNDPEVMDWMEASKIAGAKIEFRKSPGENKIIAVDTAFQAYKKLGRTGYINVLSIIKGIWNGDADSYQSGILKGFAYIYSHCEENVNKNAFINSLSGYPIKKIEERAKMLQGSMEKRFANAIIEQYNKKKTRNRIILP